MTEASLLLTHFLPPWGAAIPIGLPLFALSWVYPRKIVQMSPIRKRLRVQMLLGVWGALLVLATTICTSWLTAYRLEAGLESTALAGWWRRPAPLIVTILILLVTLRYFSRQQRPHGLDVLLHPRRKWLTFAPKPLVFLAIALASGLLLTSIWQGLIGVGAKPGASIIGPAIERLDLPIYMEFNHNVGLIAGVGWPNHLLTIAASLVTALLALQLLRMDARRDPVGQEIHPHRRSTPGFERTALSRTVLLLVVGAFLATLGAVLVHAGFLGEVIVGLDVGALGSDQPSFIGTTYSAFARFMHIAGLLLQGMSIAVLGRLAVDCARGYRRVARPKRATWADGVEN